MGVRGLKILFNFLVKAFLSFLFLLITETFFKDILNKKEIILVLKTECKSAIRDGFNSYKSLNPELYSKDD